MAGWTGRHLAWVAVLTVWISFGGPVSAPAGTAPSLGNPNLLSPPALGDSLARGDSPILIDFGEEIVARQGTLFVTDTADRSRSRTISLADSNQVTISGSLLTVRPNQPFAASTVHTIQLSQGAVVAAGDATRTFSGDLTWAFRTEGETLLKPLVIPLQHVWGNNRYLDFGWGTWGQQRGVAGATEVLKAPGVEFIFERFFGVNGTTAEGLTLSPIAPGGPLKRGYYIDNVRNALVVVDTEERIALYKQVAEKIDRAQTLVEISVAIVDVSTSAGFEWESEILVNTGTVKVMDGNTERTVHGIHTTDTNITLGASAGGLGGLTKRAVADSPVFLDGGGFTLNTLLQATRGDTWQVLSSIRALEARGDAQTMSRPAILTLDNHQANIHDEVVFFVRVAGVEDERVFPIRPGTDIRVLPHVVELGAEGARAVRLAVYIKEGTAEGADSGVDDIPLVSNSSITTQAVIRENESLLIAGSYVHDQQRSEDFVPIIGKIPVIGLPFKDKRVSDARFQRMFLITPRVLDPDDVEGASRQEDRIARMLDDIGAVGAGLELNQLEEGQVQGAQSAREASGGPAFTLFPRLRRAWHTNQNP